MIDLDDDNAYQYLGVIINAFEQGALESNKREAFMGASYSTLAAMDATLASSDAVLASSQGNPPPPIETTQVGVDINISPLSDIVDQTKESQASIALKGGVAMDVDLLEAMGLDEGETRTVNGVIVHRTVAGYMRDCLGCDLRIHFDWQLKPINLLGPIAGLLNGIEDAIDMFRDALDPYKLLLNLCDLLNKLRGFCIPDLIAMLMALKMLLKKYGLACLEIKLDWTALLGPLLKVILELICSLLNQIAQILLAPINCAIAGLTSIRNLELALKDVANTLDSIMSGDGLKLKNIATTGTNTLTTTPGDFADTTPDDSSDDKGFLKKLTEKYPNSPSFGSLNSSLSTNQLGNPSDATTGTIGPGGAEVSLGSTKEFELPTAFNLTSTLRLDEAIKDPAWLHTSIFDKVIVALQDAKFFILDLVSKLNDALLSLNALVSGGLSLNLKSLGIILLVLDMINLVRMIIKLMNANPNITDWCEHFRKNPQEFAEIATRQTGLPLRVKVEPDSIDLLDGPNVVGRIVSCTSQKSQLNNSMVEQWIRDLERGH